MREEPIPLDYAKNYLRVDGNEEDFKIEMHISAARNHCENEMGVEIGVDTLTAAGETIPIPPVVLSAILLMTEFFYRGDETAAQKTLDAVSHLLRLSPAYQRTGAA